MHFMSVEVSAQRFLFPPGQPSEPGDFDTRLARKIEKNNSITESSGVPFTHIHLHDLESLWWVAVWIVFYNEFRVPEQSNEAAMLDHKDIGRELAARTLFPTTMESARRRDGFQQSFLKICEVLQSSKGTVCASYDLLRQDLIEGHRKVQAKLPHSIDLDAIDDQIYNNFRRAFQLLQALKFTLAFIPDMYAELRRKLKQSRA
jgi:hypothetical protein